MPEPDAVFQWSQASQARSCGKGICYGLCKVIGRKLAKRSPADVEMTVDVSLAIMKLLEHSGRTFDEALSQHKGSDQWESTKAKHPFPTGVPLYVFCNIGNRGGYVSHYSLFSYANPFAWMADHVCLLWHGADGDVVLFDPSWGVAIWCLKKKDKFDKKSLDFKKLNEMIASGYKGNGQDKKIAVKDKKTVGCIPYATGVYYVNKPSE